MPSRLFQILILSRSKTSDCENSFGIFPNHREHTTCVESTTHSVLGCERLRLLLRSKFSSIVLGTIRSASRISSRIYIHYFMLQTPVHHPMTHFFLTSSPSYSWFSQSEALWISSIQPTTSRPKNTTNWRALHCSRARSLRILLSAPYRPWHVQSLCFVNGMLIFSPVVPHDLLPFLIGQTWI